MSQLSCQSNEIWCLDILGRTELLTSVSFCKGVKADTNDFEFGRSRGSYCKQREAKRTSSVPSSLENCPSKQESVSIWRFLSRIRSRAWNNSPRARFSTLNQLRSWYIKTVWNINSVTRINYLILSFFLNNTIKIPSFENFGVGKETYMARRNVFSTNKI